MKIQMHGLVGAIFLLLISVTSSFAIEGLHVSVQSTNAVLIWPSLTNETYIVQYESNLNAGLSWTTLTNYLAASSVSNITRFVDKSNIVTFLPPPGGGSTNGNPNPGNTNGFGNSTNSFISTTGFYRVVRDGVHIFWVNEWHGAQWRSGDANRIRNGHY